MCGEYASHQLLCVCGADRLWGGQWGRAQRLRISWSSTAGHCPHNFLDVIVFFTSLRSRRRAQIELCCQELYRNSQRMVECDTYCGVYVISGTKQAHMLAGSKNNLPFADICVQSTAAVDLLTFGISIQRCVEQVANCSRIFENIEIFWH